jgi:putative ATPase
MAIDAAMEDVKHIKVSGVPNHLRDRHYPGAVQLGHGDNYKYAHDYPNHYVKQQYLPDELIGRTYYNLSENGYEKKLKEWLRKIKEVE